MSRPILRALSSRSTLTRAAIQGALTDTVDHLREYDGKVVGTRGLAHVAHPVVDAGKKGEPNCLVNRT